MNANEPLAYRMSPKTLDDYVGQEHILGKDKILYRTIKADRLSSIILWGPPGCGKTSLARVISNTTKYKFTKLNAVTSGVSDIKNAIEEAKNPFMNPSGKCILFIDEIHRFNKMQQDALLPFVENGTVILIGATTENPYFEVNKALISRSMVFRLLPLTQDNIYEILKRSLSSPEGLGSYNIRIEDETLHKIAETANGDVRTALNGLEVAVLTTKMGEDGFITITNYIGSNFENIKAGNERVVVARLDDAIFFFKEDTKIPFDNYVEKLKGITFQKGMGSMYDKTQRIIKLSESLAQKLNAPLETVKRTALLCKADLVTSLVFEFTELQGFIGSDYAFNSGEKKEVVQGIKEHYYPLGSNSELAESIEGQIVGIADKIDTIVAVFAEGKKPTGSADPLGVRRATLGIIKTVIQKSLDIDLEDLIKQSINLMPVEIKDKNSLFNEVKNFFENRLSIYYTEKYRHDIVDACISNKAVLSDLKDFAARVEFLSQKISSSDFNELNEAANRIVRITKDYQTEQLPDKALFNNPAESKLMEYTISIDPDKLDYRELYNELSKAVCAIDEFFDKVLVMDKDEKVKENRLALLYSIKKKFDKIADFSKLVI